MVAALALGGCWETTTPAPSDGGSPDGALPDGALPDGGLPGCAAQDARGEGLCRAFFGYAWNGRECAGLSGCECVGSACDATYETPEACQAAYAECGGPVPGPCDAQDVRTEGLCDAWFGYFWTGRECAGLSGCSCLGADCDARYESIEACERAYSSCGAPTPGPCDAQDARGEGACRAFFGYAWNGRECTGLSGCECVGADCESLYASEASCWSARAHCVGALSCDPVEAWCDAPPPPCPAGQVPEVVDRCWGACVGVDRCAPIACSATGSCPAGMRCGDGYCQG